MSGGHGGPSPPPVLTGNIQGNSRKAGSLNRKLQGVNSSGGNAHHLSTDGPVGSSNGPTSNHHKSLNSPTSLVGGHSIHGRDGFGEHRQDERNAGVNGSHN